jgi:hypothetical protein
MITFFNFEKKFDEGIFKNLFHASQCESRTVETDSYRIFPNLQESILPYIIIIIFYLMSSNIWKQNTFVLFLSHFFFN